MKYKYQSVFSQPLKLKQLFNQVRSKKISVLEFLKKSLKLIFIKIKKSIPKIFIAETKTIYSSLSIGTMIMTLLSYHYIYAANFPFTTFLISCLIAYLVVKTYLQLNKWGGRESNHLEIWIPLYLLFLSYAITIQSFVVSRFITLTYGVLPETFTNVVNYVSRMTAFQDSLVVILFPLLLLMLNFSKKFFNNTKWELLWVILSSYFAIIFIFVAVLSKWDTVFFKPYEYWIEKHSFVNIVHCNGKNYTRIRSHRLKDNSYIWKNQNYVDKKTFEKKVNKDYCKNKKYCHVTCKKIKEMQSYLDNVTAKIDFLNHP